MKFLLFAVLSLAGFACGDEYMDIVPIMGEPDFVNYPEVIAVDMYPVDEMPAKYQQVDDTIDAIEEAAEEMAVSSPDEVAFTIDPSWLRGDVIEDPPMPDVPVSKEGDFTIEPDWILYSRKCPKCGSGRGPQTTECFCANPSLKRPYKYACGPACDAFGYCCEPIKKMKCVAV